MAKIMHSNTRNIVTAIAVVALLTAAATAAMAVPVYNGTNPRGIQIFVLPRQDSNVRVPEVTQPAPAEAPTVEASRAKQHVSTETAAVAPAKPGKIRMGKYMVQQPKSEPAPVKKPVRKGGVEDLGNGLHRAVVDPRKLPVFKGSRVRMPDGCFNVGLENSPFTITEMVRLARRRCLGMALDGNVLQLNPMGDQPIWLVLEPAAVDRGEIWIPKSETPVKYPEFEPGEPPTRVRITGGWLLLRPGVVEAVAKEDVVGRGSKSDPVYAQTEAVMALRKAAGDQRQWGRVLAGTAVALSNGWIVKAVTHNTDGFKVQSGLDFPKWEFFRAVSKSKY